MTLQPTRSNREHSFDWELAVIVGHEKAILLKNIAYWCEENQRRGLVDYFQHGQWWARESLKSLSRKYPYFTMPSISRWVNQLCDDRWVRMFGQSGGTNFYAPGEVFIAWNSGADWKALVNSRLQGGSQNENPVDLLKMRTPVSQNEKVGVLKMRNRGSQNEKHEYRDIECQIDVDVECGARAQKPTTSTSRRKSDTSMPSSGAARPTTFAESAWAKEHPEAWRCALVAETNIPDLDAAWYFNRVKDWSAEKTSTSANWVVTAAKFARDDQRKQKLVTLQSITDHDQPSHSNPRPNQSKPAFRLTTTPDDVRNVVEAAIAARSRRYGVGTPRS